MVHYDESESIDKAYVSPYDKFLFTFDAEHEKSASQLQEIRKHKRIAFLRDHVKEVDSQGEVWERF